MRQRIAIGGCFFASLIKLYLQAFGVKGTVSPISINRTRNAVFEALDNGNTVMT